MTTRRLGNCLALSVLVLGLVGSLVSHAQSPTPLFILLTNDDGVHAPGLAAMRTGLEEAGHRVLTVAPSENRSGSSGALTVREPLAVSKLSESIYSVDGTPVDSARVGIMAIAERRPDLVVSGINEGQNAGPGILMSGTVGAAMSAHTLGIPAIAISQMIDLRRQESANDYYEHAASAVVSLIERLMQEDLLQSDTLLNVNHPLVTSDQLLGWSVTTPAEAMSFLIDYSYEPDKDAADISFALNPEFEPHENSDEAALSAGRLSITPLNWRGLFDSELGANLEQMFAEESH